MHLADPGSACHDGGSGYILPQLPYSLHLLYHLLFSVVEGDSFSFYEHAEPNYGRGLPSYSVMGVLLSLSYGTPKKIGWLVVANPATQIFGNTNKSLRNKVQYLFSGRKRGYANFDK